MDLSGTYKTKKLRNYGNYQTTKNIEDVAERARRNLFVVRP